MQDNFQGQPQSDLRNYQHGGTIQHNGFTPVLGQTQQQGHSPVAALANDPQYELVDTWTTDGLGEIKVYAHRTENMFKLHKKFDLSAKYGATPEEISLLEMRLKELPQEITLASGDYRGYDPSMPLFQPDLPQNDICLEYSSHNLRKHVLELKRQGLTIPVHEGLGYFGFLMGLGSFMEQDLEFHRSVCLKNLLIMEREGLQLMNPYVSDNHIRVVLEEYVRPILQIGDRWLPQMFVDEKLRAEVGKTDQQIRNLNNTHRKHIKQMHIDACLTFLSLATTEEEQAYVSTSGIKNPAAIERGIQTMLNIGYPWEIVNILRTVLLPKPTAGQMVADVDSVPTFIEINESISPELRDMLMNSILNSKPQDIQIVGDGGFAQGLEAQQAQSHMGSGAAQQHHGDQASKQDLSAFMESSPYLFR